MEAANTDCAGSQVIKKTFISLDSQRKKWKKLQRGESLKAIIILAFQRWGVHQRFQKKEAKSENKVLIFTVYICYPGKKTKTKPKNLI